MRRNVTGIFVIALLLLLAITGCDSGKPMPTGKLEGVLPDTFTDWAMMNTVRNGGGPPVSEVTGYYQAINESVAQGLGAGGEIRISIEDWGETSDSPQLPVTQTGEVHDYRGLKYSTGFTPGNRSYQVKIPVGNRILIVIEFDDTGADNELEVLEAINWDYLAKIHPSWDGLQN
jgi:hypothetical protein